MARELDSLNWIPFDPRNAESLAYDGKSLYARFKSGAIYEYAGVPDSVWVALQRSGGSGKAFVDLVRGRFSGVRLE